ncbi:MAG: hypothetical protein ICV83_08765 [Cytophagales bacterium]|nr:hypothetical protein [Cytophagales bacterium]
MLSIIICSKDEADLRRVSANVADTVGVPFEIIATKNSGGKYGICEAYNLGAARSRYPYLCFMHEDVQVHTPGWGGRVAAYLADTSIGLVGVAGAAVRTRTPSPWYTSLPRYNYLNLIQHTAAGHRQHDYHNPDDAALADVVTVDGVWFCCRREVWQQHPFDAHTFRGFHFYDVDFASRLFTGGYRVCVAFDILIEHFSPGSYEREWIHYALVYARKWRKKLPLAVPEVPQTRWRRLEYESGKHFLGLLVKANVKGGLLLRFGWQYLTGNPHGWTWGRSLKEKARTLLPTRYRYAGNEVQQGR